MNQQIVNLRGLAILLVVLGHSIIIYDSTFDLLTTDVQMPLFETVKHIVSFVQMKLFISISGFLLAYKFLKPKGLNRGGQRFVKNKAIRLLVPYLFVVLLYNDPLKYALHIPGYESPLAFVGEQLLGTNCAHLWYLPCLFLLMMAGWPLFLWAGRSAWKHCALFFAFLALNYFSGRLPEHYQLSQAGYYLVFFHLGYWVNFVRQAHGEWAERMGSWKMALALLPMVVGVGIAVRLATSIGFEVYLSIVVVLAFYKLVPAFNNRFVNEVSKRSYGLYLFHSPLIYLTAVFCPNINPWLMLFLNFVCAGSVAYLLTVALSKSKLKFVIGE